MNSLALKLVLTPALIGAASLAGRRWGPVVSGWLVGLPLTSGPILFFLALNHGATFARATAIGTLTGAISEGAFCLGYGWIASRFHWPVAVASSFVAFALATAALQYLTLPLPWLFGIVILSLLAALGLMPTYPTATSSPAAPPPRWDIPARMVIATVFVLLLTDLAPALGPHLTGLVAPFPVYATTLAVFAHRHGGPAPAVGVLKGLLLGMFSFVGFFLVLAALIERVGIAPAFAAATFAALLCQGGTLWLLQRKPR